MLLDISNFLGRLHPVLVHLPIGFLVVLAAFDLFSYSKRFKYLQAVLPLLTLFSFVAAVLAAVFGYLLSLEGDYPQQLLANHRNGGWLLLISTGCMALVSNTPLKKRRHIPTVLQSSCILLLLFLTVYVGHQGGNLTHGEDYLSWDLLQEKKRPRPDSLNAVLVYEDLIQPLLIKRCSQCHRDSKRKGQLTVGSIADLIKGGKTGPAVVPGKPGESELMHRILLDPSDEKFMPTDGKTPLTKDETALLNWWIEKGKAAAEIQVGSLPDSAKIKQIAAVIFGFGQTSGTFSQAESGRSKYPDVPLQIDTLAIRQLKKEGFYVRTLLHDPVLLDITLPPDHQGAWLSAEQAFGKLAKHVLWLNLSSNNLHEQQLKGIIACSNLKKLRLDKNPVGDSLYVLLKPLHQLEALNISETSVTAEGEKLLQQLPGLKRIYRRQTGVRTLF